jgi:hypothetical protein
MVEIEIADALKFGGPLPRLEGNAADKFPRAILGRVKVGAFIMASKPGPHIVRQADVGRVRGAWAPEQINRVPGRVHRLACHT